MSEWKECKLGALSTKIGSGATPKGGSNSYKDEGISLIRSQNILDFKFSFDGLAFIDNEQADCLKNVTPKFIRNPSLPYSNLYIFPFKHSPATGFIPHHNDRPHPKT